MGDRRNFLIHQIVKYSQRLDQKNFGANHDGNISAKWEDKILATPTAVSKGNVVPDIIITLDREGKKVEGNGKPFSEIKLHLVAYRERAEVKAVVHAHPPFATARGLVGLSLECLLPEAVVSIGEVIPVVPFAMPGASENDEIIAKALSECDVFMMPGNGVFAVGEDVEQAYLRLELVEHLAKIQFYAEAMGNPARLSAENMASLLEKRASIGLGPKKSKPVAVEDQIKNLIAEEIKQLIIKNE